MKALLSDIHGKADRLQRYFELNPNDPVICLGDAVGLGDSERTLRLLRTHDATCVLGNHEDRMLKLYEVSDELAAWVGGWPCELIQGDVLLTHTWMERDKGKSFTNIDSIWAATQMFAEGSFRVAFVGHSHSPGWWELNGSRPVWTHAQDGTFLEWKPGFRYIVDVGSFGEPRRESDPNYAVWTEPGVRWLKANY